MIIQQLAERIKALEDALAELGAPTQARRSAGRQSGDFRRCLSGYITRARERSSRLSPRDSDARAHVRLRADAIGRGASRSRAFVPVFRRVAALSRASRLSRHVRTQRDRHRRPQHRDAHEPKASRSSDVIARHMASFERSMNRLHVLEPDQRAARDGVHSRNRRDDRRADRGGHAYVAARRRVLCGRVVSALRRALAAAIPTNCSSARASRPAKRNATRSISRCGSSPSQASRHGRRRGATAGPAGTSSARRCRTRCSASRSTSTAAATISSSRTTRTRSRRAKPLYGAPLARVVGARRPVAIRREEDVEVARQLRAAVGAARPPRSAGDSLVVPASRIS